MGSEGRIDLRNFIGGEFTENEGGAWMDVVEPATGMAYARTPLSGDADVDRAVAAARAAQPGWGSLSHKEWAEWLDRIADALEHVDLDADWRAHQRDDLDLVGCNGGPARKTPACIAE